MGRKNSKNTKSKTSHGTLTGTLDVTRSGIGYVIVENREKDIFIRPQDFNHALHGDRVSVKITREGRSGRMEGEITEVVERKQSEFVGRLELNKDFGFFIPDKAKGTPDMYIPGDKTNGAKNGDRVVVRITEWNSRDRSPNGEVISILNAGDENDMAMKEILVDAG
ncbi:MAG: ribonuclease R, partial [Agriterribacter sp.]